ncbi:MAG: HNH endonuclease, partial [Lachnospira eligens]|nr:HNH endonuclease [Lachnospira eligens]
ECGGKKQEVCIDIESLSMHTFITGSTGKGKSTAIYSILDKLLTHNVKGKDEKIKFMVIEPAKGEYKNRFGNYDNVHVYGTNYKKMPLLKINPFSFPDDIHVLEHIDRLIEIFNVCWPMYAAMPAVLKDSIERAYFVSGWNLETSECRYQDTKGNPLYPSFIDVLHQINKVMDDSAYSADSKGDYKGALCTRLKSLTNGLYSQIFTNDELSGKELFDENVIIDLSRTGSSETKSLIMGLLVMKLQEYRMANAGNGNAPLKHVTVLEEAHNILKRTSTEQSSESSNMLGKSVEMLANSIAEMRTYGEGFIIADQAPGLMDMSVIRNTNTKIILGLPDLQDRQLVGRAAGLNDDQIIELSRLKTFVAAVYQNNWLEPVLCNIDTNFKDTLLYSYVNDKTKNNAIYNYIDFILDTRSQQEKMDRKYIDTLNDGIYKINISSESRIAFIKLIEEKNDDIRIKYMGQILWDIFNTESALRMVEEKTDNIENWYQLIKEVAENRREDKIECSKETLDKIKSILNIEKKDMGQGETPDNKNTNELKNNFKNLIDKYFTDKEVNQENTKLNDSSDLNETQDTSEYAENETNGKSELARTPENHGHWTGERGNSKWIPDEDYVPPEKSSNPDKPYSNPDHLTWGEILKKYGIDGIRFKDGFPDFSEVSKGNVQIEGFETGGNTEKNRNFKKADIELAKQRGCSPEEVKKWREENNYTWHECEDKKTMQKVPNEIHANVPHDGGRSQRD